MSQSEEYLRIKAEYELIITYMGGRYERIEEIRWEPKGRWLGVRGAKYVNVTHPQWYNHKYSEDWNWLMAVVWEMFYGEKALPTSKVKQVDKALKTANIEELYPVIIKVLQS